MSLSALLERVEAATGPDHEVNGRLYCLANGYTYRGSCPEMGPPPTGQSYVAYYTPANGEQTPRYCPAYTASVDAALALIGRVLPGHASAVGTMAFEVARKPWGCIWTPTGAVLKQAEAATPALALCAALLAAMIGEEAKPSPPSTVTP